MFQFDSRVHSESRQENWSSSQPYAESSARAMSRGSESARFSLRDIVLPAPRERVSLFSLSVLARLSERVTGVCARAAVADAISSSEAPACGAEVVLLEVLVSAAAAAPRSATLVLLVDGPPSALREREPLPTANPVATTAIVDSVSEVLSAALGARRALEARCLPACGSDDDTCGEPSQLRWTRTRGTRLPCLSPEVVANRTTVNLCERMTHQSHRSQEPQSVTFSSISVTSAAIGD